MTATTTWPRSQHWTVDGFRVSVLVYKSHRHEACDACGQRGAIHAVWAERKTDGMSGGPADFCDAHRPAKGPLPELDYRKYYRDNGIAVCERYKPSAEWPCSACGQPARVRQTILCEDCNDPRQHTVTTMTVMRFPDYAERTDTKVRHEQHTLAEWHECDSCRSPAEGTTS